MLPNIKQPTHTTKLPVSGKSFKYRPFLVSEEKALLMVKESEDKSEIFDAIRSIVKSCTSDKFDTSKETVADTMILFFNIRSRSASEVSKTILSCPKCDGGEGVANINLADIDFDYQPLDNIISLGHDQENEIFIKLKNMSFDDFVEIQKEDSQDDILSIKAITVDVYSDSGKSYNVEDWGYEDWETFYLNLSSVNYQKIHEFLNNSPKVKLTAKARCGSCGADIERSISDIENFT